MVCIGIKLVKRVESISEAADKAFGKLPQWVQFTLVAIFSIVCDA
jgi:hypothetical protein